MIDKPEYPVHDNTRAARHDTPLSSDYLEDLSIDERGWFQEQAARYDVPPAYVDGWISSVLREAELTLRRQSLHEAIAAMRSGAPDPLINLHGYMDHVAATLRARSTQGARPPQRLASLEDWLGSLANIPRAQLTREQRAEIVRRIRGAYAGLPFSVDEYLREKQDEAARELAG